MMELKLTWTLCVFILSLIGHLFCQSTTNDYTDYTETTDDGIYTTTGNVSNVDRENKTGITIDDLMKELELLANSFRNPSNLFVEPDTEIHCNEGVFCLESNSCVNSQCVGDGSLTIESLAQELSMLAQSFSGYRDLFSSDNPVSCDENSLFCPERNMCVPRTCAEGSPPKMGACPASDVTVCVVSQQCQVDSDCVGLKKCCEHPCGGKICRDPALVQSQTNYMVLSSPFAADPPGIEISRFFAGSPAASSSITFNMNSASNGCKWSKVMSENKTTNADGTITVRRSWAEIKDKETLSASTLVNCRTENISFHGFVKVNVTDEKANPFVLGLFIIPVLQQPVIVLEGNNSVIELKEGMEGSFTLPVIVKNPVSYDTDLSDEDAAAIMASFNGFSSFKRYSEQVDLFAQKINPLNFGVFVRITSILRESPGQLLLNYMGSFMPISFNLGGFGSKTGKYLPNGDWNGNFTAQVCGWTGILPFTRLDISEGCVSITFMVLPVNEVAGLDVNTLNNLQFDPRQAFYQLLVPYNASENPGVLVGDIVSRYYRDAEGSSQGMCLIRAEEVLGRFQYKAENSNKWNDIDDPFPSDKTITPFHPANIAKENGKIRFSDLLSQSRGSNNSRASNSFASQCLLLSSTSYFRFNPQSSEAFWPFNSKTNWIFTAWDEKVDRTNKEGDLYNITLPFCYECLFEKSNVSWGYITGDAMRLGCNRLPSPVKMVFDVCGVCNGDGKKCVDCSGTKDGTAIYNQCGVCVGGSTSKPLNDSTDCKGGCSNGIFKRFPELGDDCLPVNTNATAILNSMFCDGRWKSSAKIDECGTCYGGFTNRTRANMDKDVCNICSGDGKSCLDCNNTAFGKATVDVCGKCKLPNDPTFNRGCQSIGNISPDVAIVGSSGRIRIEGAGLESFTDAQCALISSKKTYAMLQTKFYSVLNLLMADYPVVDMSGNYTVSCNFTSKSQGVTLNADVPFIVYGLPTVSSISPSSAPIGSIPSEVLLVGSGFIETGEVSCVLECARFPFARECLIPPRIATFPAKVIDNTHVKCSLDKLNSRVRLGMILRLSVSLTDLTFASDEDVRKMNFANFTVIAPPPVMVSANFLGACTVVVQFDTTISDVRSCSVFEENSQFGTNPVCFVRGSSLFINFGTSATFSANKNLTLISGKVSQRSVENPSYASGVIEVSGTTEKFVNFESFRAPDEIGNCDAVTLRAKFQGAYCLQLTYQWSAISAENDTNTTANDLDALNSEMQSETTGNLEISASQIVPGSTYTICVNVTTGSYSSDDVCKNIKRLENAQPILVDLGGDRLDWDPEKPLKLKAVTTLSKCASFDLQNMVYIWTAPGVTDFSLSSITGSEALIKAGLMRGGVEYSITVIAASSTDSSKSAQSTIRVTTISKDLVAIIRRAPYITTGASENLDLDASLSYDPDKSSDDAYYTWSCEKNVANSDGTKTTDPCSVTVDDAVSIFEASSITADKRKSLITLPSNSLQSSSLYTFCVTYSKGQRSSKACITVDVVAGKPPFVYISPVRKEQNANNPVRIFAYVSSDSAMEASWLSISGEGYESLEFTDDVTFAYKSAVAVNNFPVPLLIRSGLTDGATYKFQLDVSNADASAIAEIEITTNAPPKNCDVQLSANDGVELTTDFEITVSGCEDNSDGYPLTYMYFAVNTATNESQALSIKPLSDSFISRRLAKGVFDIEVVVCDQGQTCTTVVTEDSVNVTGVVLDTTMLDDLTALISAESATGGESPLRKSLISALTTESATDDQKSLGKDLAKQEGKSVVASANPAVDPEGSLNSLTAGVAALNKAGSIAIGGNTSSVVDEDTKDLLMAKAEPTAAALIDSSSDESRRRRRRAAGDSSSTISPLSVEAATEVINVLVTALKDTAESEIKSDEADSFFKTVEKAWQAVCADIASGEDGDGLTDILTFRAAEFPFSGISNTSLDVSSASEAERAKFQIGESMISLYSEWSCSDATCYGGCMASGQLSHDILTARATSPTRLVSARFSDIIAIHLINPETNQYVQVENLTQPITISIKLTSKPQTSSYNYKCRAWDESALDWSEKYCTMNSLENVTSDVWQASCSCNKTGYFGVFEGDAITTSTQATTEMTTEGFTLPPELTTQPTITSAATTAVTTTAVIQVTFKIAANFSAVVGNDTDGVVKQITKSVADIMGVNESRISNMKISAGSIVVSFDLLPSSTGSQVDSSVAMGKLQQSVSSGNAITINGQSFSCEPSSFSAQQITTTVSNVSTKPATTGSLGIIIGAAVGGSLFVILVIVVVAVIVLKKKNTKIHQSPMGSHEDVSHSKRHEEARHSRASHAKSSNSTKERKERGGKLTPVN